MKKITKIWVIELTAYMIVALMGFVGGWLKDWRWWIMIIPVIVILSKTNAKLKDETNFYEW